MPHNIIINHLIEILTINAINLFIFMTLESYLALIPIVFSTIYSIGRIKRDIQKYHDGDVKAYLKFIVFKIKKMLK